MKLTGGIIAIGSLYWEDTTDRVNWRLECLDLKGAIKCKVPIRYGRKSDVSRNGIYTMVFSNEIQREQYGSAKLLPLKEPIVDYESFININKRLAEAEGIIKRGDSTKQTIVTSWGTNCILINPNLDSEKSKLIFDWWVKLFSSEKNIHNQNNASRFSLRNYGLNPDAPCINDSGVLQIDFPGDEGFDFLLATATKVKLRDNSANYPDAKEIAKAMMQGNSYKYFYNNTANDIRTKDDRMVKKILRKVYSVNREEMFRSLKNA